MTPKTRKAQSSIANNDSEPAEFITPKQLAILNKRYEQARKEIASGQGITTSSADELQAYLESEDDQV